MARLNLINLNFKCHTSSVIESNTKLVVWQFWWRKQNEHSRVRFKPLSPVGSLINKKWKFEALLILVTWLVYTAESCPSIMIAREGRQSSFYFYSFSVPCFSNASCVFMSTTISHSVRSWPETRSTNRKVFGKL